MRKRFVFRALHQTVLTAFVLFAGSAVRSAAANNGREDSEARAKELVAGMTLEEKCNFIGCERSFFTRPVERLGIPSVRMADGPQGIRNNTTSTLYPCGIATAASWNREAALKLGNSLGSDARARGVAVLLGPGVNIYRAPMCGRNFEYFGEDPFLASEIAKNYIIGVQERGVMATVKHFAANNQEWSRHHASSDVDERTMMEIYFPAFRKAVREAKVAAVMDSYNPVSGVHASENRWMNVDVLRNMWGFDGILMSDWTSVYSSSGAANGGLDLECPRGVYFTADKLVPLIKAGVVRESDIDRKVFNILQTMDRFGLLDNSVRDDSIPLDNPASDTVALELAREGIVLLENRDGELPLKKKDKVLVLGPNATYMPFGGGSGEVTPFRTVSVAQGLKAVHGPGKVTVLSDDELYKDCSDMLHPLSDPSKKGFDASFFNNKDCSGTPEVSRIDEKIHFKWGQGSPDPSVRNDQFSCRWEGAFAAERNGTVRFSLSGDDGYRIIIDAKVLAGHWSNHSLSSRQVFFKVEKGRTYQVRFEYFDNSSDATAICDMGFYDEEGLKKALSSADKVVFCGGFNSSIEGEGFDRPFSLPKSQLELIDMVSENHRHLTVVLNAGGAVDFNDWSGNAEAVLMAWYPGQEGGRAVAEVLCGEVCPSGKLPVSFENKWEDNPVHDSYYDNTPVRTQGQPYKRVEYREGIFVGYRGYDCSGTAPRYPFGYGLSYTDFKYEDLRLEKISSDSLRVTFTVKNTGKTDAKETAQVYVRDMSCSVPRPLKELKGFDKKMIGRGGSAAYEVILGPEAFSFYSVEQKGFRIEAGEFEILVGPSSAELPLRAKVYMNGSDGLTL